MFKKKVEIPVWLWALMMLAIAARVVADFSGSPDARVALARVDDLERVVCALEAAKFDAEDVFVACLDEGPDYAEGRARVADHAIDRMRKAQREVREIIR